MPDLTVDFICSLDGHGAAEGWPGSWGPEGPEYLAWIGDDAQEEHPVLMGATTYRLMSGYAAEMPDEPGLAALTALPEVVCSSTLREPLPWAGTEPVDGDAVEAVRDMKRRGTRSGAGRAGCARSAASASAGRCSGPAWWTASAWSSSRSSPASPGGTASSTGIPTSPSSWPRAARPTAGCSCSSTSPPCSTGPPGAGNS